MNCKNNYSAFGVQLTGRNFLNSLTTKQFRYGYQNSEQDDEIKGDGNSYTTEFRQLDPRLGRWLSLDPVVQPWQSPYCSMDNKPILFNDPLGDKIGFGKAKDRYATDANEGESYKAFKERFKDFKKATQKDLRYLKRNSETFKLIYKDLKKSENEYLIKPSSEGSAYNGETCELELNRSSIELGEADFRIKLAHELAHTWRQDKGLDNLQNRYESGSANSTVWTMKKSAFMEREAFHMELIFSKELGIKTRDYYGEKSDNANTNTIESEKLGTSHLDMTKNIQLLIGPVKDYDYSNKVKGYHYKQLLNRSMPNFDITKYSDYDTYSGF